MIPTIPYIRECFDECNKRFFDGQLPPIAIKLSHAKGFLGKVTFVRKRQGLFSGYRNEDFVLRINARIDLPEELIVDTILHEMIHYHIAVNHLQDSSTHGRLFRAEMERINSEGNRHLSITHRLTTEQLAQAGIHKKRAIALVSFSDGKVGIKIVPDHPKHIHYWHYTAIKRFSKRLIAPQHPYITDISWFRSDNDFFASFPSSIAMRIFIAPEPKNIPLSEDERVSLNELLNR